jgi:exopolysaccharide biosynthesis polyprenyl glycosylphosphotransferase
MKRERELRLWRYGKVLLDGALIVLAFAIAYWIRYELQWIRTVEPAYLVPFRVYIPSILALTAILLLVYWLEGAYRLKRDAFFYDEFYLILRGTVTGIAAMIVIIFLATPSYYSRLIFGYTGIVTVILLGLSRAIERAIIGWRHKRGLGVERVLIVGAGEMGRSVMRAVVASPQLGYRIVGFLDDDPIKSQTDIGRYPALGTTDKIAEVIASQGIDQVIIALPWTCHAKIQRIMEHCQQAGITVRIVPDLFQMTLNRVVADNLNGVPLLGVREPPLRDWQRVAKRLMDVVLAGLGLVISAPLLALIALAIKLDSPGPVIFRQTRVGRGGVPFTCFKFRSMFVDAESRLPLLRQQNEATGPLFKMRDDPRRTRVGRVLRRMSLDELPQLWNVLKGEMSLVGPRPPLPSEVEAYAPWHLRRLEVSPGLTGLWQVSGRSDLTFDEMVLLDIYYIENWSPALDLRILLRTIPTVLLGFGAY